MLTEEMVSDPTTGALLSSGTWEYKPPSSQDIPEVFNISMLKNMPNQVGILSSKAVGEPPLLLSCGVLSAVRDALSSYENGKRASSFIRLDAPSPISKVGVASNMDSSAFSLSS